MQVLTGVLILVVFGGAVGITCTMSSIGWPRG